MINIKWIMIIWTNYHVVGATCYHLACRATSGRPYEKPVVASLNMHDSLKWQMINIIYLWVFYEIY